MTELEHRPQNMALAAFSFDHEQLELIKTQIAPGASDGELALFVQQCQRTGLDPFSRQIYAVMRDQSVKQGNQWIKIPKMTIQVAIDGFRVIAERHGQYTGRVGPFWCGQDGKWLDVWLAKEPPSAAKVGVLRHGFTEPLWAVARFEAYASRKQDGSLIGLWGKMADVMIAKCAEAQALRSAFPNDLSGLYTGDEMQQADNPAPVPQAAQPRTIDITHEVLRAVNPNAEALQAWADKISAVGTKINARDGRERAVATLAHYPDWRKDISAARAAYEALCELGKLLKSEQEQAAQVAQDVEPPFEIVQAEQLLSDGQRKALCAHASRAGAKSSQDRAALFGYTLNSVKPEGTKTLTHEQASVLLDTFSGMDVSEAEQLFGEARKAFKSEDAA